MPRTSSLCLRRISISSLCRRLDHDAMAIDERRQVLDGAERLLDFEPLLSGVRTSDDVDLEPPLGLLQATLQELLALVQARVADLEVLTAIRQLARRGHRVVPWSRRVPWPPRPRLLHPRRAQVPARRARRCDPARGRAARRPPPRCAAKVLDLGLHVAAFALHAGQRGRAGGEAGIVRVELAAELRFAIARAPPTRHGAICSARVRPSSSAVAMPRRSCASSKADAVAPPLATPTRQPVGPKRSPSSVTTTACGFAIATSIASAHVDTRTAEPMMASSRLGHPALLAANVRAHGHPRSRVEGQTARWSPRRARSQRRGRWKPAANRGPCGPRPGARRRRPPPTPRRARPRLRPPSR